MEEGHNFKSSAHLQYGIENLLPDEIARNTIACTSSHVGGVSVVAGSNFLFFRKHQTIRSLRSRFSIRLIRILLRKRPQ